ncbi:hypothetical protein IAG41_10090 [Sphingomonas sp. JC676]|uniref:hypothetical protein n=1 Tax=Sphingomonas sp. JC676 TaxID=2768065 RepID=UPI0016583071|nr:hypothetical protein [Sphingomonas sp. JC676]MBC9032740.1 hypothetical protein [Sphingomonas sp. JC676]
MYRFLDRPVFDLPPGDQMILWSMRSWVVAMSMQKCPCATLGPSFERWRVPELLRDFNMAMFVLNVEGAGPLRFGQPGCVTVHDDEAVLLTLFHAAADGDERLVGRLAAQLVKPEIVHPFIVAVLQASDVLRRTPVPRGSNS